MLGSIGKGRMVVAPSIGVDVGVTRSQGKYIVSSSDPITGTVKRIGWHAVNVSANDVATSGIMPDALSVVGLFPRKHSLRMINSVMGEIHNTAKSLGIMVAGGHTEITPGLGKPIIVVTCFGSGKEFVTSADSKPGDSILLTKTAGIEGTSILAGMKAAKSRLTSVQRSKAMRLIKKLSILGEAKIAFGTGRVHAMHDVTEGGVIGAVMEMSLASQLGFELEKSAIPVDLATKTICDVFSVDPLRLIGSGSLLIACPRKYEEDVRGALLQKRIKCTIIGRFLPEKRNRILVERKGKKIRKSNLENIDVKDELWPTLQKFGHILP